MNVLENILNNQIWTAIGVIATIILGLAAIIVAIILFLLGKKKKRLAYYIISNIQLVGIENSIRDKIKILYDEKQVTNVHLVSIKFINNGNEPISVDDFDKPISIKYDSAVNILTHEILEKNPEDLDALIRKTENSLEIKPLLLNVNDEFIVNILASDFEGNLEVSARIKGINKIEIYKGSDDSSSRLIYMNTFIIFMAVISFFYGREMDRYIWSYLDGIVYSPIMSIFITIFLLIISIKLFKKRTKVTH